MIRLNTFLIGVQKSATSSLYNWIAQHPDICAPESMKDIPYFADDSLYSKGFYEFENVYLKYFINQKIVLQGNVNYIFFEKAIERIKNEYPDSKFILVLRNPTDRAISAYNFAVRRGLENRDIKNAFKEEEELLLEGDFHNLSDFAYKEHGLYYKQIMNFKKYYDLDKLHIILFEDIVQNKVNVIKNIFHFLNVDAGFMPELNYLNETGVPRSKIINKYIYGESKIKTIVLSKLINRFVSFDNKVKYKLKLGRLMTKRINNNKAEAAPSELINELKQYYKDDIEKLESLIKRDLSSWK